MASAYNECCGYMAFALQGSQLTNESPKGGQTINLSDFIDILLLADKH